MTIRLDGRPSLWQAKVLARPTFPWLPGGNFNYNGVQREGFLQSWTKIGVIGHKNSNVILVPNCHHHEIESDLYVNAFLLGPKIWRNSADNETALVVTVTSGLRSHAATWRRAAR